MNILEDLRTTTFSNNEAFFKKAACEIEQLRTENAALKEQVELWQDSANALATKESVTITDLSQYADNLEETISQQAAVIEQMRDALHLAANNMNYVGAKNWDIIANALLLQPSPEILQSRDEKVAEACVSVIDEVIASFGKHSLVGVTKTKICSGEWRKYL